MANPGVHVISPFIPNPNLLGLLRKLSALSMTLALSQPTLTSEAEVLLILQNHKLPVTCLPINCIQFLCFGHE